mgnify:CR=1 FL=1
MEALIADPPRRLIYLACGLPALLEELAVVGGRESRAPGRSSGGTATGSRPESRHHRPDPSSSPGLTRSARRPEI